MWLLQTLILVENKQEPVVAWVGAWNRDAMRVADDSRAPRRYTSLFGVPEALDQRWRSGERDASEMRR